MATLTSAAHDPMHQQQMHHNHHQQQPLANGNSDPKEPNIYIPDIIEERKKVNEGYAVVHKFACGKLLGKGGFARCYVGTSLTTNGKYALKIVPKCNIVKPRAKQKLQSEIKIHRALSHVNIVKFDRCFEDQHNAYILLELCNNNSMSELMKKRRKLIEPEVRFYLANLVSSLQYLHQNLVIHRDLKLGNLFIDAFMRLKVGDFGLAAKLNEPNEKKKTVCGTPNYIAPEILTGKDGHSFEVDIWSTGVVMYTLLVGKPPFETKDVKTTYKRIAECSYSFPDGVAVSDNAKSLIRSMLQLRPERRPSLAEILDHPFFSHPSSFMPASLPESAMREPPVFSANDTRKSLVIPSNAPKSASGSNSNWNRFNDENDSGAVNRPSNAPSSNAFSSHSNINNANSNVNNFIKTNFASNDVASSGGSTGTASSKLSVSKPSIESSQPTNITGMQSGSSHVRSHTSSSASRVGSKWDSRGKASPTSTSPSASISSAPQHTTVESNAASVKSSGLSSNGYSSSSYNRQSNGGSSAYSKPSSNPSSSNTNLTSSSSSGSGLTSGSTTRPGFEIYNENVSKPSLASSSSSSVSTNSSKPKTVDAMASQPLKQHSSSANSNHTSSSSSSLNNKDKDFVASSSSVTSTSSAKSLSTNGISGSNNNVAKSQSQLAGADSIGDGYLNRHINSKPSGKPTQLQQQINAAVDDLQQDIENIHVDDSKQTNVRKGSPAADIDEFISNKLSANSVSRASSLPSQAKKPQAWAWDDNVNSNDKNEDSTKESSGKAVAVSENKSSTKSEVPAALQTPVAAGVAAASAEQLNTLEAMRRMLDTSYINNHHSSPGDKNYLIKSFPTKSTDANTSMAEENLVSKVWVVRYVDYTSKYGLGFLLNNGSAGVYYNDSTKIIMSPDGSMFQYIERRKKEVNSVSTSQNNSEHVVQSHLMSAYPVELQKKVLLLRHFKSYLVEQQRASQEKPHEDQDNYSEPIHSLPMLQDTGIGGANPSIPFGSSSVAYGFDDFFNEDMTYVKKWVRTRHAILFRLSNKTVQIVFFDRSEIILSSEARVVTYVNKVGHRSEFTLEEVMQDGRADIAKRLRYTKDIMYRLINSQPR